MGRHVGAWGQVEAHQRLCSLEEPWPTGMLLLVWLCLPGGRPSPGPGSWQEDQCWGRGCGHQAVRLLELLSKQCGEVALILAQEAAVGSSAPPLPHPPTQPKNPQTQSAAARAFQPCRSRHLHLHTFKEECLERTTWLWLGQALHGEDPQPEDRVPGQGPSGGN